MLSLMDNVFFRTAFVLFIYITETAGIKKMPNGDGTQHTSLVPFQLMWFALGVCVVLLRSLTDPADLVAIANTSFLYGMRKQFIEFINILGTLLARIFEGHYVYSVYGLYFMWIIFHQGWPDKYAPILVLRAYFPYLWLCYVVDDVLHNNTDVPSTQYFVILFVIRALKSRDWILFAVWNPLSWVTEMIQAIHTPPQKNLRQLMQTITNLDLVCIFVTFVGALQIYNDGTMREWMHAVKSFFSLFV
jgi:hypothetical protein